MIRNTLEMNRIYGSGWKFNFMKSLLAFLLMLCYSGFAVAENILILSHTQAESGQIATIEVDINNDDPFVAFQLDIQLNSQLTYVSNSAMLNPDRANGHSLYSDIINNNVLRIIVFSLSNTPFNGNTGTVLTFNIFTGTIPGTIALVPQNAVITNTSLQNILTKVQNGSVTIIAPDISTSTTQLSFGAIPLGQSLDLTFQIHNFGNKQLIVDSIAFNSVYFSISGNSTFSVNPGGNRMVTVRFHAVIKGTFQKQMFIYSNDPDEAITTVQLTATAFAVNELRCGNMLSYSGQADTLHLSINNMEEFTGFQFDLVLPSPLAYQGGSVVLSDRKTDHMAFASIISANVLRVVAFSPSNVSFSGSDGRIASLVFNVFGTGGGYALNMSNVVITNLSLTNIMSAFYNGFLQVAAPDIHAVSTLAFAEVSVTDTLTKSLRLHNYGQISLQINQLQFANPTFWSEISLPVQIAAGTFIDIPVRFHSPVKGSQQGTLRIFSNDPDENPFNISLTANAFAPNYLIVRDTTAYPIDNVSVEILINNHEPFVAFEFYLSLPPQLSFNSNPELTHLTARAPDHLLYAGMISPTLLRVFAFSLSQSYFLGNSGVVAKIGFSVNSSQGNLNLPLTLSNVIMVDNNMQNIVYGWNHGILHLITPPFPYTVDLQDLTVLSGTDTCFAAMHTINVSNLTVHSGSNITLSAGQNIRLMPGIHVENGAGLHAYISEESNFCTNIKLPSSTVMRTELSNKYTTFQDSAFKVNVFPNPSRGLFFLNLTGCKDVEDATFEVFNLQGEKIHAIYAGQNYFYELDLRNKPKGVYILRVQSGKEIVITRLISQ